MRVSCCLSSLLDCNTLRACTGMWRDQLSENIVKSSSKRQFERGKESRVSHQKNSNPKGKPRLARINAPPKPSPSKEGNCVIHIPSGAPPPRAAKAWGDSTTGESPPGSRDPLGATQTGSFRRSCRRGGKRKGLARFALRWFIEPTFFVAVCSLLSAVSCHELISVLRTYVETSRACDC